MNRPTPAAWLTDRGTLHFDKEDARRDSDGFIEPLYRQPRSHRNRDNTIAPRRREILAAFFRQGTFRGAAQVAGVTSARVGQVYYRFVQTHGFPKSGLTVDQFNALKRADELALCRRIFEAECGNIDQTAPRMPLNGP